MRFHPRPYQRAAMDALLHEWGVARRFHGHLCCDAATLARYCPTLPTQGRTVRSTLLNLGTGAGKTRIAGMVTAALTSEPGVRVLMLGDSDELCSQPLEVFREMGIYSALEKADAKASLMSQVVVGSAQTLDRPNRRQRFPRGHFEFAIQDEAHRSSPQKQRIMEDMGVKYLVGLTGTAFRTGEGDLSKYYETVAFQMGIFDMVAEGYAVPIDVLTMPVKVDISGVHTRAGEYVTEELSSALIPELEAIAKGVLEHANGHQIVAFLPLRATSDLFAQICRGNGISAMHVDGESDDRKGILREYAEKKFRVLCNAQLVSTGWDCAPCSCLLNLRPTQSTAMLRQMVGRIVRTLKGVVDGIDTAEERKTAIAASLKPRALILDPLWEVKKHGLQGAEALFDGNAEVAEKVARAIRLKRSPEDLLAITKRVQEEIEGRLKKRLDWAARQSGGLFDAEAFALMAGRHDLAGYQPFGKEARKTSGFTRRLLEKACIDPATVQTEGYAAQVLREVNKRRAAGVDPLEKVLRLTFDKAESIIQRDARMIQDKIARRYAT